jgi:hypothetical protein
MVGNVARVALIAVLISSGLMLACSDDDDEDGEGPTESGSCNGIAAISECTEVAGSSEAIEFDREFCEEIGDTWTSEPCPTTDLIGCCYYEIGSDEYRDCYYVGHIDSAATL